MTWRPTTRDEIQAYYRDEFMTHLGDLPEHITPTGPHGFALSFRQEYPVQYGDSGRDFIRRQTWETNSDDERTTAHFEDWQDVLGFLRQPARNDPLRETDGNALGDPALIDDQPSPVPEAVYYRTTNWERTWVVPVDIDAKDVAYERARESYDHRDDETREEFLGRAGIYEEAPGGFQYAFEDIRQALVYGFAVKDIFEETLNAERTQVVYSGQGCHVYLLDDDPQHRYDQASREVLIEFLETEYDIPIDAVVTADEKRVMRLPYSLHADVSRVVTPIESADFDFRSAAIPGVLSDADDAATTGTAEASNETADGTTAKHTADTE